MNTTIPAIKVRNLTKSYKEKSVLKGVNLTVPQASIFSLLGSNGAGKTTILKILATLLRPDSGSAEICSFDVVRQAGQVRSHISLTGQFAAVDELLTGKENLWTIGELRHLLDKKEQADELMELFRLTDVADHPVSTYSGGMRRRLDIAMSMMGISPVIFLDEPTSGLDPQNRLAMWDIIKSKASAGTTIFLTTQYLDEAEYLADHVAVLHEGVIIADGTADELKDLLPRGIVQLQFKNKPELEKAIELLREYKVFNVECECRLDVQTDGGAKQFADILNLLNQKNVEILKFCPKQSTLEDAFLTLIGEKEGGHNP
ncbi:ATP-binding cassette domain-containing protein [Enterococcus sp. AZ196]|uniref:ATP-binding cassette domain-containing protein n=1 Tax=Enterococcus sp. AZ196 TaxID=2774659 RepID=UPI003D27F204